MKFGRAPQTLMSRMFLPIPSPVGPWSAYRAPDPRRAAKRFDADGAGSGPAASGGGRGTQSKNRNRMIAQIAASPSFHVIFFPSV